MAEIINLRRVRKQRARDEADKDAAANRATFGQTKAERERTAAEADLTARTLDAHRREPPDET